MGQDRDHLSAAYAALVDCAERELEAARAGDVDALAGAQAARVAVCQSLPTVPPPGAAPALRRAAELQTLTTASLASQVAVNRRRLTHIARGRDALAGYSTPRLARRQFAG